MKSAVHDTLLGLKIGAAYDEAAQTNDDYCQDGITGHHFGAHHGQVNWNVAYEFRAYDDFSGGIATAHTGPNGTVLLLRNDADDDDTRDVTAHGP